MTFSKNKDHYLNKIFILQAKTKLSTDTIHYSHPTFYYSSIVPTNTVHEEYAQVNFSKVALCKAVTF